MPRAAYDDLLVSLKALKRKLEARPIPQSPFASIFHDETETNPKNIEKFLQAPTIGSVANLVKQTEKMREVQQSSGLTAAEVTSLAKQTAKPACRGFNSLSSPSLSP